MRSVVMTVAMLLGCAVSALGQGPRTPARAAPAVPRTGAAPTLDGDLAPGEWAAARRIGVPDSLAVYLMRDSRYLYVAVRTHFPSVGSLCVRRGDTVRVLHASAALGTAVYARDSAAWRLVTPFAYRVRERDLSPGALRSRAEFLASDGWVATTAYMGSRVSALEFRIRLDLLDPADRRLGIASRNMSNRDPEVRTLPPGLADGCADPALVAGDAPATLSFDPATWFRLRFLAPKPPAPAAPGIVAPTPTAPRAPASPAPKKTPPKR